MQYIFDCFNTTEFQNWKLWIINYKKSFCRLTDPDVCVDQTTLSEPRLLFLNPDNHTGDKITYQNFSVTSYVYAESNQLFKKSISPEKLIMFKTDIRKNDWIYLRFLSVLKIKMIWKKMFFRKRWLSKYSLAIKNTKS